MMIKPGTNGGQTNSLSERELTPAKENEYIREI
jgi:hypothetical protein